MEVTITESVPGSTPAARAEQLGESLIVQRCGHSPNPGRHIFVDAAFKPVSATGSVPEVAMHPMDRLRRLRKSLLNALAPRPPPVQVDVVPLRADRETDRHAA
jgi:hypothetical protein